MGSRCLVRRSRCGRENTLDSLDSPRPRGERDVRRALLRQLPTVACPVQTVGRRGWGSGKTGRWEQGAGRRRGKDERPAQSDLVVPDRAVRVVVLAEHELSHEQQNRADVAAAKDGWQGACELTELREEAVVVAELPQTMSERQDGDQRHCSWRTLPPELLIGGLLCALLHDGTRGHSGSGLGAPRPEYQRPRERTIWPLEGSPQQTRARAGLVISAASWGS